MTIFATQAEKDFAANLGGWIADVRKRMGMSQEEFGSSVGVHRNTLGRWELGESMPTPYQLARIKRLSKGHVVDAAVSR